MSKNIKNQKGFGLIVVLIAVLIIALIYLSGLHLLGNTTKKVKEDIIGTSSPLEKAKEVKNIYDKKEEEILKYLNNTNKEE